MRRFTAVIMMLLLLAACNGRGARKTTGVSVVRATRYSYVVKAVHPHSTTSYTQGLQYVDGVMWEGTGQYGESRLQTMDIDSGRTRIAYALPDDQFGEGITVLGNRIYYLTWQNGIVHVLDRTTHREVMQARYDGEGWGLTTDGRRLFMSDGTDTVRTVDPETFRQQGTIHVTLDGKPLYYLNELEWIDGKIWANIYTSSFIAVINPETGVTEGLIDLTGILPDSAYGPETDVLNGIAYDAATGRIFVTGKNWNALFEIEIVEL